LAFALRQATQAAATCIRFDFKFWLGCCSCKDASMASAIRRQTVAMFGNSILMITFSTATLTLAAHGFVGKAGGCAILPNAILLFTDIQLFIKGSALAARDT
jgi:hypothetical protein